MIRDSKSARRIFSFSLNSNETENRLLVVLLVIGEEIVHINNKGHSAMSVRVILNHVEPNNRTITMQQHF